MNAGEWPAWCIALCLVGCGSSSPPAGAGKGNPTDAGGTDDVVADAPSTSDGPSRQSDGSTGPPPDAALADASGFDGGTLTPDGGVLLGPVFDPGFVPCGQSTLGDSDLQAACNATMGGTPNAPPTTPLQCTALTGSVEVAVGCKESSCQGYHCVQAELWVRVTARSTGNWSFSPGSEIDVGLNDSYLINRCWSQTQTPGGLVNEDDPGGMCGTGWTGQQWFVTTQDSTMARMFDVPGGTYTASGQTISGTVWFPLDEAAPAPSTTVDAAFALAVPFTATLP